MLVSDSIGEGTTGGGEGAVHMTSTYHRILTLYSVGKYTVMQVLKYLLTAYLPGNLVGHLWISSGRVTTRRGQRGSGIG